MLQADHHAVVVILQLGGDEASGRLYQDTAAKAGARVCWCLHSIHSGLMSGSKAHVRRPVSMVPGRTFPKRALPIWDMMAFPKNRNRLLEGDVAAKSMARSAATIPMLPALPPMPGCSRRPGAKRRGSATLGTAGPKAGTAECIRPSGNLQPDGGSLRRTGRPCRQQGHARCSKPTACGQCRCFLKNAAIAA